jgi:integral membrane protein
MNPQLGRSVTAYRAFAYLTGVGLVLLVFVGLPLKYLAGSPGVVAVVGTAHGYLYLGYLIATLNLGTRLRWSPGRLLLVMAAGTVPFMSFVAERRVVRGLRAGPADTLAP